MNALVVWTGLLPRPAPVEGPGARLAGLVPAGLGLLDLVRGGIDPFAPNVGSGPLAGIDLTRGGDMIVMRFAVIGASQTVSGLLDLLVAQRYRAFVPLRLLLQTTELARAASILWIYKPSGCRQRENTACLQSCRCSRLRFFCSLRGTHAHGSDREVGAE